MTQTMHRLWQILGVVEKEAFYLRAVILRLFPQTGPLAADQRQSLFDTPEGIDRLESFVGKFSRMQDTLVDKLLPTFLLQTAMASAQQRALEILARYERRVPPRFPETVRLNVMNP